MERDIKVIVAEATLEGENDYSDCNHSASLSHRVFSLDELLNESWFIDLLKTKGLYSKDELGIEYAYLDKFVYEYGSGSYTYFNRNISEIPTYQNIVGVYQEVIGPERLKGYAKWKRDHEEYKKKEAETIRKELDKKEAAKAKRREREIAKAKQILSEEGIIS